MAWWAWRTGHGAWGRGPARGRWVLCLHFYRAPRGKWGEDGKPQLALELPIAGRDEGLRGLGCGSHALTSRLARVGSRLECGGRAKVTLKELLLGSHPPPAHLAAPDGSLGTLAPRLLAPEGNGCCCVADGEPACQGSQPGRAGGSCRPS